MEGMTMTPNLLDKGMVLTYLGPLVLALFWIWGRYDNYLISKYSSRYRPIDPPKTKNWSTTDVSVICATVGTKRSSFIPAVKSWIANSPGRILIVTVPSEESHVQSLLEDPTLLPLLSALPRGVEVIYSPKKGKRAQLAFALRWLEQQHHTEEPATWKEDGIICNVDNHIVWQDGYLSDTVRCFEDPKTGGVSGPCDVKLPDHPTLAQSLAAKIAAKRNPTMLATYAVAKWAWCLTGCSVLYRAEVLCDPEFYEAYLGENWHWMGKKTGPMETGEDNTISRYLMRKGWQTAMQYTPRTQVFRVPKASGADWTAQMCRWERSSIRHHIMCLSVPAVWQNAYVLRKTVERVMRPVVSCVHIAAWIGALVTCPRFTFATFLYYLWEVAPAYASFFAEYPSTPKYFWLLVLVDYFYIPQDIWCWLTLNDMTWVTNEKKES